MKFIYPAVIGKKEDGSWYGYFPDLEMCEASAPSEDVLRERLKEAEYNWIALELEDTQMLPFSSDESDVELKPGEQFVHFSVNYSFQDGYDE